jgi:hypothetical protein
MLAPKAEVSMFPWKEPKERIPWRCARYIPSCGRIGPLQFSPVNSTGRQALVLPPWRRRFSFSASARCFREVAEIRTDRPHARGSCAQARWRTIAGRGSNMMSNLSSG